MSSSGLDERDEQVLAAMGQSAEDSIADVDAESAEEWREVAADLAEQLDAQRERHQELVEEFEQFKTDVTKQLNQLSDAVDGDADLVGATTLDKYAAMDEETRQTLGPTDRRAAIIHENWDELSWQADGKWLVDTTRRSTAKNQPAKFKLELERELDESLQWNEVYRAMKAVARLSGGEPEQDEYGREKILGGEYEYHERPTPDGKTMKKVLVEVPQ